MSTAINNILVPFDLSFKYAVFSDAKVILLHVTEDVASNEIEEKIRRLANNFETESGLKVGTLFLKGNIYEKLSEAVKLTSAKLIVTGIHSSSISVKNIIGHNIFKFINNAQCPVITLKENIQHQECRNIVLPIDLTKESREKVAKAIELAKHCRAPIRLVSVFSADEIKSENKLLVYTHQAKKFIKENGVACSNRTISGENRAQIVIDYANKIKADLIIITTQFSSSVKEFLKGTVSQQIINISNIPVMSLPPMQRKDTTSFSSPY
jgi:nucleotide-binding universal stress UspA family protein